MTLSLAQVPVALLFLTGLAACATPAIPPTVETTGMPNAELALERSLAQVDSDVGRLGTLLTQAAPIETSAVLPAELHKQIVLQWRGPLDGAVQRVGDALGYQVTIERPKKSIPVEIAFNSGGEAIEVLRTLGDAAGTRATVAVDPLHHQIRVVHHV